MKVHILHSKTSSENACIKPKILKFTNKNVGGWGFAPYPTGGAYDTPQAP